MQDRQRISRRLELACEVPLCTRNTLKSEHLDRKTTSRAWHDEHLHCYHDFVRTVRMPCATDQESRFRVFVTQSHGFLSLTDESDEAYSATSRLILSDTEGNYQHILDDNLLIYCYDSGLSPTGNLQ